MKLRKWHNCWFIEWAYFGDTVNPLGANVGVTRHPSGCMFWLWRVAIGVVWIPRRHRRAVRAVTRMSGGRYGGMRT